MQGHAVKSLQKYIEIPLHLNGVSGLMEKARRSEEGFVSLEDLKVLSMETFGEEIFHIFLIDRANILRRMQKFKDSHKLAEFYVLNLVEGEYYLGDRVEKEIEHL
ncbi:MAG TPA: hypothetical protein VJJ21_02130 [Candidatus Nanoarchaeia archaeon]|nr:hypothetical protein [Candidatus Nanoarchaeia archaeon]